MQSFRLKKSPNWFVALLVIALAVPLVVTAMAGRDPVSRRWSFYFIILSVSFVGFLVVASMTKLA